MLPTAALDVGLDAPLVRSQVEHLLFIEHDDDFKNMLSDVATQTRDTQNRAETRMRERMEREQAQKMEAEKARIRDEALKEAREKLEAEKPPESPPQGLHPSAIPTTPHVPQRGTASLLRRTVTVVFHVEVPPSVTPPQIEEQLLAKMHATGFKRVASITVE